jgi:hypothetical protein
MTERGGIGGPKASCRATGWYMGSGKILENATRIQQYGSAKTSIKMNQDE